MRDGLRELADATAALYVAVEERHGPEVLADWLTVRAAYLAASPAQRAIIHALLQAWGLWAQPPSSADSSPPPAAA